jgi:hypothetical protein
LFVRGLMQGMTRPPCTGCSPRLRSHQVSSSEAGSLRAVRVCRSSALMCRRKDDGGSRALVVPGTGAAQAELAQESGGGGIRTSADRKAHNGFRDGSKSADEPHHQAECLGASAFCAPVRAPLRRRNGRVWAGTTPRGAGNRGRLGVSRYRAWHSLASRANRCRAPATRSNDPDRRELCVLPADDEGH